jgi:tetratricopeptide (TPR) repeat protein
MAAYTLYDLGEKQAALDMTRAASAKPGVEGAKAAVDYARLLLLSGGNEEAAAAALGQAEAGGALSGEALDDLQATKAILATRQADKLREAGNYSQAEAVLAPSLAARPDDPTVLMAAGRLAASRGRDSQAMEYFDKAYQQDASNIDIIRGVVFGAIQARELSKAEEYLAKGMEQNPDNAWLYFLKAQVARARGNYGEAMEALQRARALNQQKGGVGSTASPADLVPASRS